MSFIYVLVPVWMLCILHSTDWDLKSQSPVSAAFQRSLFGFGILLVPVVTVFAANEGDVLGGLIFLLGIIVTLFTIFLHSDLNVRRRKSIRNANSA